MIVTVPVRTGDGGVIGEFEFFSPVPLKSTHRIPQLGIEVKDHEKVSPLFEMGLHRNDLEYSTYADGALVAKTPEGQWVYTTEPQIQEGAKGTTYIYILVSPVKLKLLEERGLKIEPIQ